PNRQLKTPRTRPPTRSTTPPTTFAATSKNPVAFKPRSSLVPLRGFFFAGTRPSRSFRRLQCWHSRETVGGVRNETLKFHEFPHRLARTPRHRRPLSGPATRSRSRAGTR